MTPYQYRKLKSKLSWVSKVWHYGKKELSDWFTVFILAVSIVMFPMVTILISNIFG